MPLVKVKTKYQVTLPSSIREKAGISVGDLLEAEVDGNRIMLSPKTAVDRELAMSLADIKAGRVEGPFKSVDALLRSLRGKKKARKK